MKDKRKRSPTPPLDPEILGLRRDNLRLRQENILLSQFEWEANQEIEKLEARNKLLKKLVETQGQALNVAHAALPTDRSLSDFRNLQGQVRSAELELAKA